jgi:hypothetical protein
MANAEHAPVGPIQTTDPDAVVDAGVVEARIVEPRARDVAVTRRHTGDRLVNMLASARLRGGCGHWW